MNDFKDWLWDLLLVVMLFGFVINLIVGAI
jgi:hypothetical protein